MTTKEWPQVPPEPFRKKKSKIVLPVAVAVAVVAGTTGICLYSLRPREDSNNGGEPSGTATPPDGKIIVPASLCDTQSGTQEGQLEGGTPLLSATTLRPSVFVVSPDRSGQQSFRVKAQSNHQSEWYTITHAPSVGIVGLATADTIFDTTQGRSVWAKTCEPTSQIAVEEADSRAKDLCERPDMRITEVVVYHVGADGKPVEMNRRDC